MTAADPRTEWRDGLPAGTLRGPVLLILSALGYFISARLGHLYAMQPSGLVVVWPASGFMLACLLIARDRHWPLLLLGGVLGNVAADMLSGASLAVGLEGSLANGIEVAVAAWVVIRLGGRPVTLTTLRQVAALVVGGAIASNALTAFVGTLVLVRGGMQAVTAWLAWWIGDGLGMLLVTPVIVGLIAVFKNPAAITRRRLINGALAIVAFVFISNLVLSRTPQLDGGWRTEPYVLLPLLFIAVIRFRSFGAAVATLLIGAVTVWHAAHGQGAFADAGDSATTQAVRIYVFLATSSLTTLFASAILSERERAYAQERVHAAALGAAARQASFIADVATALTEGEDLASALQRSAEAMVRHLDAAIARIWLVDDVRAAMALTASAGAAADVAALKAHSYPLVVNDRIVGVMTMLARGPLSDSSVQALRSVARTIALGIERRQLDDARARLAAILEATPDFVTIGRLEGPPLYVNRAARRALGIGPDETVPSLYGFRPDGFTQFFESVAMRIAERDGSWSGETEYVSRDGRVIPVSQVSVVHAGPDGESTFISTISRDITERRRAAESLRQSEERVTLALEAAQASAWVHDLVTNEITISGRPERQTLEDFLATVHPDDREAVTHEVQMHHASGDRFDFEFREIRPDGSTRWMRARGRVIRDDAGRAIQVMGVDLDITEFKELEEQLRQAQKIEAVGQLAGGLAHDFNNLLTAILGYAQQLEESYDAADPRRLDAGEIRKAGERAGELTRQLLAFSRKQILRPVVLDLNEVVEGIARMLSRLVGEDIHLETRLDPQLKRVKADRGQVEQILVNLGVNARDAMEHGGTLTIETANVALDAAAAARMNAPAPGPYVMLSVRDTGIGMTPEIQRRIFEPFFTTKAVGKGTGMGLATVFGIAKQSGGAVAVESECGRGTTFRLYLPQTTDEPAATAGRAPVERTKGAETVLVVDDDPGVLAFVSALLKRDGYTVLTAADPKAAVQAMASAGRPIDLLVTDVVLPSSDGPAMFAELRAMQPSLRVLFMSGFANDAIVQRGLLAPGTLFIPKPFNSQSLLGKVREALNGS